MTVAHRRRMPAPAVPVVTAPKTKTRVAIVATALAVIVAATAFVLPLFVTSTQPDSFRMPKQMVYELSGTIALAVILLALLYRGRPFVQPLLDQPRHALVGGLIVLWTAVTTLTSTNRIVSARTLFWVIACTAMVAATIVAASRIRTIWLAVVPLIPAAVNAVLAILQRADIYNPIYFDVVVPPRMRTTAYIGNPTEVAAYLVFNLIAAAALAVNVPGRLWKVLLSAFCVLMGAGILATETLTALAAAVAGLVALALLRSRRAILPIGVAAAAAVVVVLLYAPIRQRVQGVITGVTSGRLLEATSLRLPPFMAAWRMFADRPLFGVGPGCYGPSYLPYKLQLNHEYPSFFLAGENYAETHNDHLQTLAVAGFPGLALLVAAMVLLARQSFVPRREDDDTEERDLPFRFARTLALPLTVAFFTAALAQFPLELASTTSVLLHFAALCVAWTGPPAS